MDPRFQLEQWKKHRRSHPHLVPEAFSSAMAPEILGACDLCWMFFILKSHGDHDISWFSWWWSSWLIISYDLIIFMCVCIYIYIWSPIFLPFPLLQKAIPTNPPCGAENFTEMLDFQGTHGMFAGDLIQAQQTCRNLRNHLGHPTDILGRLLGRQKRDEKKMGLEKWSGTAGSNSGSNGGSNGGWNIMKHHERWWKNVRMAQFPIPIFLKKCFPSAKSWNIVPDSGLPDSRAASGSALPTPRNSTGIGPRRGCRCVDICNTTGDASRTVWTSGLEKSGYLDLNGSWGPVKVWLAMACYGLVYGVSWNWTILDLA